MPLPLQANPSLDAQTVAEPWGAAATEFQQALHQHQPRPRASEMLVPFGQRSALGMVLRRLDVDLRSVLADAQTAPQITADMSIEQLHLWGMQTMIRHTHARVQFDTLAASVSGVRNGLQQLIKGS